MHDTLKIEGVLTGEEWLTSQFLLSNEEAMQQTVTITKKIEDDNKDKLNKSDISRNARPISEFGTGVDGHDHFLGLSKMGYAHPSSSNFDRSLASALKTRPKIPRTPDGVSGLDPNWKRNFQPAPAFDMQKLATD